LQETRFFAGNPFEEIFALGSPVAWQKSDEEINEKPKDPRGQFLNSHQGAKCDPQG
jgi:hypothetical protein